MRKRSTGLLAVGLAALLFAAGARADTTDIIQPQNETPDQGFQAATCTAEVADPGPPPQNCSVVTPGIIFRLAAGHPKVGFTQYTIEHEPFTPLESPPFPPGSMAAPIPGEDIKEHTIKTLRTDLPPGLTVNPEATASRCSMDDFLNVVGELIVPACAPETRTGTQKVTLVTNRPEVEVPGVGTIPIPGFVLPPTPGATEVPIYNLVPEPGEPAKLGFVINGKVPVFLETEVAWESDFHESFTIKLLNTAEATGLSTLISRLVSNGAEAGNGTYLTNPTTCFDSNQAAFEHLYSTWFRAESYADPDPQFPHGSTPVEAKLPKDPPGTGPRVTQEGCDSVPFEPSLDAAPTTGAIDSASGGTVTVSLPFDPAKEGGEANQSQSHLRRAEVTLPPGMGLNPSGAKGLVACTDAQFKKGVRVYENECPAASVIGSAEITSPPLAEPLVGDVYVGEQQSSDPESGRMFRILVEAKSEHEGIAVRLVGAVRADRATGRLTAVFDDQLVGPLAGPLPSGLPQVPFEAVRIKLDAAKSVLTTPPVCGPATTTGAMEPWARPGTTVPVSASFTLSSDPGGGACPTTPAARRFAPTLDHRYDVTEAGAFTPYRVVIARTDGEQELKVVDVTLPPGLTGTLAGIPYCPEAAIAAAAGRSGAQERSAPSCPAASRIGTVHTTAGTGADPVTLIGHAYLAGPYKGAPLSMVTVTPALEGPFDLGTVVVRVALHVDPRTTQITADSDVIPDVFGGVKLDLRHIAVVIDRERFMRNATNCQPKELTGTVAGGGANPADPAAFSSFAATRPYRVQGCRGLGFRPRLRTVLFGPTKRAKNPRLRATLTARRGDANLSRTALTLPHSLFLDQSHIRTVCTRVQLAARQCPSAAVYGRATAVSPLLDKPLRGPVYLVSSDHTLPDLVADLRGQVNVRLYGVISSKRGGLKTVFNGLPDVPVSRFVLDMRGGRRSLLVNSTNTCRRPQFAVLNIKGQNGKRVKSNRYRLNIRACAGKGKRR